MLINGVEYYKGEAQHKTICKALSDLGGCSRLGGEYSIMKGLQCYPGTGERQAKKTQLLNYSVSPLYLSVAGSLAESLGFT